MTRIHETLKSVLEGTYPIRGKGADLGLHAAEQYFLLSGNIDLEEPPFCIWRNGEFTEAGKRFVESYEATVEETKPLPAPALNDAEKTLLKEKGIVQAVKALCERTGCSLAIARDQILKQEVSNG